MMDLVLRLREARRIAGMTQRVAAERSGLGEKTISSWESGSRIDAMGALDLQRLLDVYGLTPVEFYSTEFERRILAGRFEIPEADDRALGELVDEVRSFAPEARAELLSALRAVVAVAKRPCEHAESRPRLAMSGSTEAARRAW